jgi:hypothetical protein
LRKPFLKKICIRSFFRYLDYMSARKRIERRENLTARVEEKIIAVLQELADESELTLSTYARYVLLHAAKHRLVVRHSIDTEGVITPETLSSRLAPQLRVAEPETPYVAPRREDDDEPPPAEPVTTTT